MTNKRKAPDISTSVSAQHEAIKPATDAPQKSPEDKLITNGNQLRPSEFCNQFVDSKSLVYQSDFTTEGPIVEITMKYSKHMTPGELDECYNLIESTSRADYESSTMGWHPKRKRREMKEDEIRYLLVRRCPSSAPTDSTASCEAAPIGGFMSFMLTHDSVPSVPVVYIYEIHLVAEFRKLGLGKHLMEMADSIAQRVGVAKVMLTCFLSNQRALEFYRLGGYGTDECSPQDRKTRNKTIKPDYVIMSKVVVPVIDDRTD